MSQKVSVIIPTYNRGDLILYTINSVLSQSYENYEIIIVDDGSTDDTVSKIKSLIEIHGEKIKYIYQENSGCYAARNKGIKESKGDYISILDSDDLWHPSFLEIMTSFLDKYNKIDVVFCDSEAYYSHLNHIKKINLPSAMKNNSGNILKPLLFREGHICHGQVLLRREIFDKVGLFDEFYRTGGDREFNVRLARKSKFRYINYTLFIVRKHSPENPLVPKGEENVHINRDALIFKYDSYTLKKILADSSYPKMFLMFRRRIISRYYYIWGKGYFIRGDFPKSTHFLVSSVKKYPFNFRSLFYIPLSFLGINDKKFMKHLKKVEHTS